MLKNLLHFILYRKFNKNTNVTEIGNPKKILLFPGHGISDIISSTASVKVIRDNFPDAFIAIVVRDKNKQIVANLNIADQIYAYKRIKDLSGIINICINYVKKISMFLKIRRSKFDLSICLIPDFVFQQALAVYVSGSKVRIGYHPYYDKDLPYAYFYNFYVKNTKINLHKMERVLNIIRSIDLKEQNPDMKVAISPELKTNIDSFLTINHITEFATLHISAKLNDSIWDEHLIDNIINNFLEKYPDIPLFLTYLPTEANLIEKIQGKFRNGIFQINTPDISFLGALIERSALFIAPTGGTLYLAAALDVPQISVFFDKNEYTYWKQYNKPNNQLLLFDKTSQDDILKEIIDRVGTVLPANKK